MVNTATLSRFVVLRHEGRVTTRKTQRCHDLRYSVTKIWLHPKGRNEVTTWSAQEQTYGNDPKVATVARRSKAGESGKSTEIVRSRTCNEAQIQVCRRSSPRTRHFDGAASITISHAPPIFNAPATFRRASSDARSALHASALPAATHHALSSRRSVLLDARILRRLPSMRFRKAAKSSIRFDRAPSLDASHSPLISTRRCISTRTPLIALWITSPMVPFAAHILGVRRAYSFNPTSQPRYLLASPHSCSPPCYQSARPSTQFAKWVVVTNPREARSPEGECEKRNARRARSGKPRGRVRTSQCTMRNSQSTTKPRGRVRVVTLK